MTLLLVTSSFFYPRSGHPKFFSSKLAKKYYLSVVSKIKIF